MPKINENSMRPLVSVIIPIFNSEKTLKKTLESIIDQTYDNFEIFLIDDGSTDSSKIIIDEFISAYPQYKIKYLFQQNQGASAARNVGLKNANGDYIALLDSDDFWHSGKIELQLEAFKNNKDIDFLATNRNDEKFGFFFGFKFEKITKIPSNLLLYKNFFLTPTVLFKREIIDDIGYFDEEMSHSEDLNYFLRISHKYNCYLYNESLVTTGFGKPTFGHSGLSKDIWTTEAGELKNIKLGYRLKIIGPFQYVFISVFSRLKFARRVLITFARR